MFENVKKNISKYLHKFDAQEGGGRLPFREKSFCFVERNDIRVADIVGVFVIVPVLNPAAVFAKAVAVLGHKDVFAAHLAGRLNFGIRIVHFLVPLSAGISSYSESSTKSSSAEAVKQRRR